ncbi:MAG: glyoxalase/bleomycin resistance/extradiol dioxygenase family protein [Calditrichia bacterium]
MKIKAVLETCLYAEDLNAAEKFYVNVLGLQKFARVEGRHLFFRCGKSLFFVFNPTATREPNQEVLAHGATGPGHVAFSIDLSELDAWKDHLRRHRIEIEAEVTWPTGGQSIYFRDPAGNSVELASPQIWGLPED